MFPLKKQSILTFHLLPIAWPLPTTGHIPIPTKYCSGVGGIFGTFGIQLEQKLSHYLATPRAQRFCFLSPEGKCWTIWFLFPLSFNHPELVVSSVLGGGRWEAHVEIYFQELSFEWILCLPLEGSRAPLHTLPGTGSGWSSKCISCQN